MSRSAPARHLLVATLLLALLPVAAVLTSHASALVPPPDADRQGHRISVIAGEQVRITGTAPRLARAAVVLQRRVGAGWRAVGGARTDRSGRYAFAVRVRKAVTYRVVTRDVRAGRERLPVWTSPATVVRIVSLTLRGRVR